MATNNNEAVSGIKPPGYLHIESDNKSANWKKWRQQFEWYATAIQLGKKPADIQAATFMSIIGPDAIDIYNSFNLNTIDEQKLSIIIGKFEEYFAPKNNISFERYVFFKIEQHEDESFNEFITRIKTQANKCEFGTLLEEMLKDKIVFGIKSTQIREKLLTEEKLDLTKATAICKSSEQASKQLNEFENNNKSEKILTIKSKNFRNEKFYCKRCGSSHKARECQAYNKLCTKCNKAGHFAKMCRSKIQLKQKNKINTLEENSTSENSDESFIGQLSVGNSKDWTESVETANTKFTAKLDTGAECNVLPNFIVQKTHACIQPSRTKNLISYSNNRISVLGEVKLQCKIKKKTAKILFKVVAERVTPVLGLNTCEKLGLIARVETLKESSSNDDIFKGLGCYKNFEYDIDLIENPKFEIKPTRKVPHAIRNEVKQELDRMVKLDVITPETKPTPAVSPMVVVRQKGKLRICIDPSDVNKNILRRHFPLATIEEIAADIKGSEYFSLLDCTKGFWQIKLSKRTQKILTFSTPWGRYSFKRLPFGLSSAPEIFQEILTNLLSKFKNVKVSIDDIFIHAKKKEELQKTVKEVIETLKISGFKLNQSKCIFEAKRIKFLGHIVSAKGLEADPEKVKAIEFMKTPQNKKELQRILGMITYLNKYIPNMSELTNPLRDLLHKDTSFNWEFYHDEALNKIKKVLQNPPVLKLYDVNKPVTLSVDASSKNLGAALLQEGQPVAYGARTLTKSEQNYPQIEKEALAILFGCKKFHEYVYGKELLVESDHKPLETIFRKNIQSAPARLQRIMLNLTPYSPKITFKKGTEIPLADFLSRDCDTSKLNDYQEEDLKISIILPTTFDYTEELIKATKEDPHLQLLLKTIMKGFPEKADQLPTELHHYFNFKEELTYFKGLIFKGHKIVVPKTQIPQMLKYIHQGHLGIQSCLKRAHQLLYWRGQYEDIVKLVKSCSACEKTQKDNTNHTVAVKRIPSLPWQIVASDLFELKGKQYIVICDSYSGYLDFQSLKSSSSTEVINHLKQWFSTHGIPEVLESDNGPQYMSREFKNFQKEWRFTHSTSSPHHPQGNGLAERAVQTAKKPTKEMQTNNLGSPNQRLYSRITRSLIPTSENNLKPKIVQGVTSELKYLRNKQANHSNKQRKEPTNYELDDRIRHKVGHRQWEGARVIEKPNDHPRSIIIKTDKGQIFRRNIGHIHNTLSDLSIGSKEAVPETVYPNDLPHAQSDKQPELPAAATTSQEQTTTSPRINCKSSASEAPVITSSDEPTTRCSRFGRTIKPVDRLDL
ncbi:uncharacterized protein K02A2.6 [Bombyx mori]|uniref:uncharacterized protein K02A2.6 n=1 Tax=Bombyx mori TaxID=7091 RepID=UPI002ED4248A